MKKQRPFTKEFEDEAVRLATTSGRTRCEIVEDLGVGLSTLVRWNGRGRGRDRAAGTAAGRPPFSPGREVNEVRARRSGEERFSRTPSG